MLISKREPYHLIECVWEYIHLRPLFTFVLITATVKAQYKIYNNVEMSRNKRQKGTVIWSVPMCTLFTIKPHIF